MISLVSSIETLGTFKQGESISLKQSCASCSYVNFTRVSSPSGAVILKNVQADKDGSSFNYTINGSLISEIGTYIVEGRGDVDGTDMVFAYDFDVKGGSETFFIILLILFFGLTFYGIAIKNEWVSLIGCFGLLPLGIYLSFNGIGLFKNTMTDIVSYITIGIGLGIGFESLRGITYKWNNPILKKVVCSK